MLFIHLKNASKAVVFKFLYCEYLDKIIAISLGIVANKLKQLRRNAFSAVIRRDCKTKDEFENNLCRMHCYY